MLLFAAFLLQAQPKSSSSSTQQHIPMLKAQQPQQPGSRAIPEGFMIPPDEQEKRLAAMKSQLLTALKPTPDTVSAVAQDSTLMSGLSLSHIHLPLQVALLALAWGVFIVPNKQWGVHWVFAAVSLPPVCRIGCSGGAASRDNQFDRRLHPEHFVQQPMTS